MTKWINRAIVLVILVIVIIAGAALALENYHPANHSPNPLEQAQATVNTTAVAAFTPSMVPGDVATVVIKAKPTPYISWTKADASAFEKALAGKSIFSASDQVIGATFSTLASAQVCYNLKLFNLGLPYSDIGSLNTIEGKYFLATNLSDISFKVDRGNVVSTGHDDGINAPFIENRYRALVTVTIGKVGVIGPEITRENERMMVIEDQKPIALYRSWQFLRILTTGRDIITEHYTRAANEAADLVKVKALTPSGDDANLKRMYADFQASFSTPGDHHIYNGLIDWMTDKAKANGYQDIQAIRFIFPNAPLDASGWTYLANGVSVYPLGYMRKFADSTCTGDPSAEIINQKLTDLTLP